MCVGQWQGGDAPQENVECHRQPGEGQQLPSREDQVQQVGMGDICVEICCRIILGTRSFITYVQSGLPVDLSSFHFSCA